MQVTFISYLFCYNKLVSDSKLHATPLPTAIKTFLELYHQVMAKQSVLLCRFLLNVN